MEAKTNALMAQADANLAALLTTCLLRPTVELASSVREGELLEKLKAVVDDSSDRGIAQALEALAAFQGKVEDMEDDKVRLVLEVDYNRLFVGPGPVLAPPYESCYTTPVGENGHGHLRGPAEREVCAIYRAHGFEMPSEFVDYPDHVAMELDFLGALASLEAKAWDEAGREEAGREEAEGRAEAGREDAEGRALELQKAAEAFRADHLGRWLNRWFDDVCAGAKDSFYPAIAVIAARTMI